MVKTDVSQDTVELLKQCDAGCRMAIDSMEQIGRFVTDDKLKTVITKYNSAHLKMEEDIHRMLNHVGAEGKEPNMMAKASSWIQAEIKMNLKDDAKQAAGLLTDGCNMGVKSLCEYRNSYKAADEKSVALCEKLCDIESRMADDLQQFL